MKKTKRILSLLLVMLCMAGLFGCGEADISEYGEDEIKIVGLLEEDFTITPNELSQLEIMEVKTTGNTKKAGTVKTYGPTLETFLAQYGKTLDEFYAIKFKAADDYKVTLGAITWNEHDVILSVANGSKALEEHQQPLRIVIPDEDSGKWVRNVIEIEFIYKE